MAKKENDSKKLNVSEPPADHATPLDAETVSGANYEDCCRIEGARLLGLPMSVIGSCVYACGIPIAHITLASVGC